MTLAFLPSGAVPRPTVPVSFRSMCHDSSLPAFLSLKAKMPLPDLMAALRSAGDADREAWIASKAAEEGKSSEKLLDRVGCMFEVVQMAR